MKTTFKVIGLLLSLVAAGCGKAGPELVQIEGNVTLDGKPLPRAQVVFVQDGSNVDAKWNSSAITDDQGHYRLTCDFKKKPGAVVGRHRVLVSDPPPPSDARDGEELRKYERELARLPNRPIPPIYATPQTPLQMDVTADPKNYDLVLMRKAK